MIKLNGKEISYKEFPNKEVIFNHEDIKMFLKEKFIIIDFKYRNDKDLIKLLFIKRHLDNYYHKEIVLRIWQMPYQRMDRSEHDSPFTLKYVSEFINSLEFSRVEVIEPHSNVTTALINNSFANYINFDLIHDVIEDIGFNEEEDFIMFPDNGAANRYKNMKFKNVLIGHKDRDFQTGKIKKLDIVGDASNASGRKVIICDDLSSYGGTFNFSSKALKKIGFAEVYLLVAHAENSIFKGDLFKNINKVFTTDSMLTKHEDEKIKAIFEKQLKVFKMEDIL